MKKLAIICIALFTLALVSSCKSSKGCGLSAKAEIVQVQAENVA
ncbi:hypothetical protein [Urechidicola sp. KH5]